MWINRSKNFRTTRNGTNILKAPLRSGVKTGINVEPIIPGMIPLYYEMLAAKEANYRYYHDWQELSSEQKASIVAFYFIEMSITNHQEDARAREIEKGRR